VATLEVSPEAAGERLDVFLGEHLGSRSAAARLIAEGLVSVNGRAVRKRHTVVTGERVEFAAPEAPLAEVVPPTSSATYTVMYEDPHLLVIDKPAGVVVHPGKGNWEGTLAQALVGVGVGGAEDRPGIVHRLDKDTSGLLVVARTEAAHRELKELISARQVRREYLTLVAGLPDARTGTIDAPLGRDRHTRTIMSLDTDSPRDARTHFEVLEGLSRDSLLRVTLETGRTHQIRVHMQAIGHPVVGDPTYGGADRYGLERQFLHAARLAFTHPITGESVDIRSDLPADLAQALALARGG
jgi:23S rRNA pseudouridine1911/1915/1917 synthase